jgi:hypothetical protein
VFNKMLKLVHDKIKFWMYEMFRFTK